MPGSTQLLSAAQARRPVERALLFAGVWFVVAEADLSSWTFGVPFVLVATIASLRLTPAREWRIRPAGALRYAWFFAHQSVAGGFDVALRAIRPSLPIDPKLVCYRLRIGPEHARVLVADTVSLLPGTLSAGIEEDSLTMHVLDCGLPVEEGTRLVEEHVADLFGIELAEEGGTIGPCEVGSVGTCGIGSEGAR